MEEKDCRIALGPAIHAIDSEGGHEYGWNKRQHCFSPKASNRFPNTGGEGSTGLGEGSYSSRGGWMPPSGASGETKVIGNNHKIPTEVIGEPIAEYNVPSDYEGVDGT